MGAAVQYQSGRSFRRQCHPVFCRKIRRKEIRKRVPYRHQMDGLGKRPLCHGNIQQCTRGTMHRSGVDEQLYDMLRGQFVMDRSNSGEAGFSQDFPAVTIAPAATEDEFALRLFVDRSSIEAFGNGGEFVNDQPCIPCRTVRLDVVRIRPGKFHCKIDENLQTRLKDICHVTGRNSHRDNGWSLYLKTT